MHTHTVIYYLSTLLCACVLALLQVVAAATPPLAAAGAARPSHWAAVRVGADMGLPVQVSTAYTSPGVRRLSVVKVEMAGKGHATIAESMHSLRL